MVEADTPWPSNIVWSRELVEIAGGAQPHIERLIADIAAVRPRNSAVLWLENALLGLQDLSSFILFWPPGEGWREGAYNTGGIHYAGYDEQTNYIVLSCWADNWEETGFADIIDLPEDVSAESFASLYGRVPSFFVVPLTGEPTAEATYVVFYEEGDFPGLQTGVPLSQEALAYVIAASE